MCPVEYLRYSSSRLHFPPYYLSNNSWWGGYFLRVIWRKWGLCLRPIIQRGMYCQDVSPTLSPYAGPTTVTASGCLVWGFQVQQTPQTYTRVVLSELLLRFPEQEVILETQKAAPLPEGSFAPKGVRLQKGRCTQCTTDKKHNPCRIAPTCDLLWSPQDTQEGLWAAGAALSTWKTFAFYGNKFANAATHSERLFWAINCHP